MRGITRVIVTALGASNLYEVDAIKSESNFAYRPNWPSSENKLSQKGRRRRARWNNHAKK